MPVFRLMAVAVVASTLAVACSSPVNIESRDGRPLGPLAPADVVEPVPEAAPILARGNFSPYMVAGVEYRVLESAKGYRRQGIASWYGSKFHGRKTANGEVFDAYAASAAHRSLPLPTYVRVTNLDNRHSMVVKVNDRGPFHSQRLIDLSYGAAVKLGFMTQGTALVEVVALDVAGTEDLRADESTRNWQQDYRFLQMGSFRSPDSALALQTRLSSDYALHVSVKEVAIKGDTYYRVRLGPVDDRQQLLGLQAQLLAAGYSSAKLAAE